MNLNKQTLTKSLVYLALSLMLVNFILLFLPCIEYRMPSYKETTIFGTEYKGWYTEGVSPFKIVIPAVVFGLPLALSILTYFSSRSTQLNRITSDTVTQPSRFLLLKFGAIVNIATICIANSFFSDEVSFYEKYGSYCKITGGGYAGIILSIALFIVLFVLTILSKTMIKPEAETVLGDLSTEENTDFLVQDPEDKKHEEAPEDQKENIENA